MKRRETKSWEQDAGRSPLVRAGSRWLSFARRLSRGRRRVAAADTLAFVESLYGGKFKPVEGGGFAPDKVYRTNGGRLFVSETRVSLSLHPRFDIRVVNIAAGVTDSRVFQETSTVFGHVLHRPPTEREQPGAGRQGSRADAAAPSLTVRTWNVSPLVAGANLPAFGYVTVRGSRGHGRQRLEATSHASRVERFVGDGATTSPSAEASRQTVAPSPAGLRLTSIDLRQHFTHAPRQEFVSLLLNTYLPAAMSRGVENARTAGVLLSSPQRRATAQGETERRTIQPPQTVVMPGPQPPRWAYAEPAPPDTPDGRAGLRTERRSTETLRELSAARDTQAPLLPLLPPASLLTSLSLTDRTLFAGEGGAAWLTTVYGSSERAPALSLQLIRPQAAQPGAREGSAAFHTTRLVNQYLRHRPTAARDALSSTYTTVVRAPSTVAAGTRAVHTTVYARPGFGTAIRVGHEQTAARQRWASRGTAQTPAMTHGLFGRPVEFVRHTYVAELMGAAPIDDASPHTESGRAPNDTPTQGSAGAATLLFVAGMTRRIAEASAARALSPTAASAPRSALALRSASAAEAGHGVSETRAARPEGIALELIRHRREEVLQLPRPGYVFTQPPPRAQLEGRQVITKASREEIVEVVRKEVRSLAASMPAVSTPSRADLAGLADEIYSTLARRLLVEKERLGRL